MMLAIVVGLLGCSDPPAERMALDPSVPIDKALAACKTLSAADRVGQCMVDALNLRDAVSRVQCAEVPGRWKAECVFQAAEQEKGPLKERYLLCKQSMQFANDCRFHLWQIDVMALKPGDPQGAMELDGIRAVIEHHRPYAEVHANDFESEIWTWYWGAWWEQWSANNPAGRDVAACNDFPAGADKGLCRKWAPAAFEWLEKRSMPPK